MDSPSTDTPMMNRASQHNDTTITIVAQESHTAATAKSVRGSGSKASKATDFVHSSKSNLAPQAWVELPVIVGPPAVVSMQSTHAPQSTIPTNRLDDQLDVTRSNRGMSGSGGSGGQSRPDQDHATHRRITFDNNIK